MVSSVVKCCLWFWKLIVGLWLGTEGGVGLEVHFFNACIVGLWLGTEGGLWLEVHLLVMLV